MPAIERKGPRLFTASAVTAIGEVLLIVVVVAALLLPALIMKGGAP